MDAPPPCRSRLRPMRACPAVASGVLLVEDEPGVRALVSRVLGKLGYTVLEASDGDAALRFIKGYSGRSIDLLLTDVVMPRPARP